MISPSTLGVTKDTRHIDRATSWTGKIYMYINLNPIAGSYSIFGLQLLRDG